MTPTCHLYPVTFMLSLVLLAGAAQAQTQAGGEGIGASSEGFVSFGIDPWAGRAAKVTVGRLPGAADAFWFRRVVQGYDGNWGPPSYATTAPCSATCDQLRLMESIDSPVPDLPGFGAEVDQIILDAARYWLEASAVHGDGQSGNLAMDSNAGSSLAVWVGSMFRLLEPCWSLAVPVTVIER